MMLILFVCVTAPSRIAFADTDPLEWIIVDAIVDSLFFVDLVLNFFMAYHDEEFTLIDDRKVNIWKIMHKTISLHLPMQKIAKEYLKSWFFIDFVSILPIQFILGGTDYTSLARIARFPKLYRLIKISR